MNIFSRQGSFFVEPNVTLTFTCPSCRETLLFGVETCRFCGEPIEEEYAVKSAVYSAMITQACSLANIIRTGKPTLVIFAAVGIMAYLSGDKLFFALSQFPVSILYCAAAIRWRYRYGDLSLPDEEFTRTQREMKWYLHLLLGFVAVEIIIMCIW